MKAYGYRISVLVSTVAIVLLTIVSVFDSIKTEQRLRKNDQRLDSLINALDRAKAAQDSFLLDPSLVASLENDVILPAVFEESNPGTTEFPSSGAHISIIPDVSVNHIVDTRIKRPFIEFPLRGNCLLKDAIDLRLPRGKEQLREIFIYEGEENGIAKLTNRPDAGGWVLMPRSTEDPLSISLSDLNPTDQLIEVLLKKWDGEHPIELCTQCYKDHSKQITEYLRHRTHKD